MKFPSIKSKISNQNIKSTPRIAFLIFISVIIISCNSREKQMKNADLNIQKIERLINQNLLNTAKTEIDSFHLLYPKLVSKRKIAAALEDTIVRIESTRSLAYCDSLLPIKQRELEIQLRNFRFEKDNKYQEFGNFVYKTQITENNATRLFLKTYIDEKSDLYLISNYCGTKIEHNSVEVTNGDLLVRSDTISTKNIANHSFSDGEKRWEILTFKNDAAKSIASFISQESDKRIKVLLCGRKTISYLLSDQDKKAISATYNLWAVKKNVAQLQNEIRKAKNRINRITYNK